MLSKSDAVGIIADQLIEPFKAERDRLEPIDRWYRGKHDRPYMPRRSSREYKLMMERCYTPWLRMIVDGVAQGLHVEGYRADKQQDNASSWATWQANRMDGRQLELHRATVAHGYAFGVTLPGDPVPVMNGVSALNMQAFYADPCEDEWPLYALRAGTSIVGTTKKWMLRLYDDEFVYYLSSDVNGANVEYIDTMEHGMGYCPVTRFAYSLDLGGRMTGAVEPLIPLAGRIDQTTFDRLIVQRFGSWKVRTIAGLVKPDDATETEIEQQRMRLRQDDLLIADDPETKFGTLDETPLDGYINAKDADIKDMAAVSQTPPHYLLGQMANLSAEALAAAETGRTRMIDDLKHTLGESHEQNFRSAAHAAGDEAGADDTSAQVVWQDTESRSLVQVATALGIVASQLNFPAELLWSKIPGLTQQDIDLAKEKASQVNPLEALQGFLAGQAAGGAAGGSGGGSGS